MKRRFLSVIALVLLLSAALPMVFAGISGSVYTAGVGRYFWRGQILDDGPALQPGVSVSLNKFTFDWWGSYSFGTNQLGASDYRVSFSDSVPLVPLTTFSSGFWSYTYPYLASSPNNTQEIFASLSFDVPSLPVVTYYYDAVLMTQYLELGVSHEMELFGFGLNGSLTGGYNFKDEALSALQGTLGISYSIAGFKINPAFTGQIALSDKYISAATWSVNLSYEFEIAEKEAATEKE